MNDTEKKIVRLDGESPEPSYRESEVDHVFKGAVDVERQNMALTNLLVALVRKLTGSSFESLATLLSGAESSREHGDLPQLLTNEQIADLSAAVSLLSDELRITPEELDAIAGWKLVSRHDPATKIVTLTVEQVKPEEKRPQLWLPGKAR